MPMVNAGHVLRPVPTIHCKKNTRKNNTKHAARGYQLRYCLMQKEHKPKINTCGEVVKTGIRLTPATRLLHYSSSNIAPRKTNLYCTAFASNIQFAGPVS